jgi:GT2 family glycosyltransferase/capsular polysaccharide biosynthesis protein
MQSETAISQKAQSDSGATIVIVTYNSAHTILDCLQSVENALRPNDQVVLVDNRSTDRTVDLIREFIHHNTQFSLVENQANLGYAAAANQGAAAGSNPYIVFLNPDTIVTPHWLDKLIYHIQGDNIAAAGPLSDCVAGLQKIAFHLPEAIEPKTDPNFVISALWQRHQRQSIPTRLLIGFCLMIKRQAFDAVDGLDGNLFLGNDDLDICLRLKREGYKLVVAKDTIVFHKGQESFRSVKKSLTDGLVQEGTDYLYYKLMRNYGVNNIPSAKQLWGIDWFKPSCRFREDFALTSIIILTYNQLHYTRKCIESIFSHTRSAFELIIVDNGSQDDTISYINSISRINSACVRINLIKNEENMGFAKGCNQGLAEARGEYLLLLNNDVVVTAGWLSRLIEPLGRNPRLGILGPMSNYVSGPQLVLNPQYDVNSLSGLDHFSSTWSAKYSGQIVPCSKIVGFCMLIKRSVIDDIGGMDGRFGLGNFEDDDFCIRAHLAGYQGGIAKDCYVHHFGSRTFQGNNLKYQELLQQNWEFFKEKWHIPSETQLDTSYRVDLPSTGFNRQKHFISLISDFVRKTAENSHQRIAEFPDKGDSYDGTVTIETYCSGLNRQDCWQRLQKLSDKNDPPYMAILENTIVIGPLIFHNHSSGRLHAVNVEQDKVSAGLNSTAASKVLSECGPLKDGSYLMLWGLRSNNFWHWMIESLSKVVMARAGGFNGYYIVPPDYKKDGFIRESLELIGIPTEKICVYDGQPWRLECLYLPQHLNGNYQLGNFPVIIDRLRQMFTQVCPKNPYAIERIYIARGNPGLSRRIVNETQLMEVLFQYGFHRITMESLSLRNQISIAAGANFLVAPHGAGMVHSLFMPHRSNIIELFPTSYVNPCMLPVIRRLKHRHFIIPSSHLKVFENDDYEAYLQIVEATLSNELN